MTIRFCIRCQIIAALVLVAGIAVALDAGVELHRMNQENGVILKGEAATMPVIVFDMPRQRAAEYGLHLREHGPALSEPVLGEI
jgi:hypothetical protein